MVGEESRAFPGYELDEYEVETDDVFYSVVSCPRGYPLWFKGYVYSHGFLEDIFIGFYEFFLSIFAQRLPVKVGVVATNLKGGTWFMVRTIHKEVHPPGTDVNVRMGELVEHVKNGEFDHVWPKRKL